MRSYDKGGGYSLVVLVVAKFMAAKVGSKGQWYVLVWLLQDLEPYSTVQVYSNCTDAWTGLFLARCSLGCQ